jgi:hypothetical protein
MKNLPSNGNPIVQTVMLTVVGFITAAKMVGNLVKATREPTIAQLRRELNPVFPGTKKQVRERTLYVDGHVGPTGYQVLLHPYEFEENGRHPIETRRKLGETYTFISDSRQTDAPLFPLPMHTNDNNYIPVFLKIRAPIQRENRDATFHRGIAWKSTSAHEKEFKLREYTDTDTDAFFGKLHIRKLMEPGDDRRKEAAKLLNTSEFMSAPYARATLRGKLRAAIPDNNKEQVIRKIESFQHPYVTIVVKKEDQFNGLVSTGIETLKTTLASVLTRELINPTTKTEANLTNEESEVTDLVQSTGKEKTVYELEFEEKSVQHPDTWYLHSISQEAANKIILDQESLPPKRGSEGGPPAKPRILLQRTFHVQLKKNQYGYDAKWEVSSGELMLKLTLKEEGEYAHFRIIHPKVVEEVLQNSFLSSFLSNITLPPFPKNFASLGTNQSLSFSSPQSMLASYLFIAFSVGGVVVVGVWIRSLAAKKKENFFQFAIKNQESNSEDADKRKLQRQNVWQKIVRFFFYFFIPLFAASVSMLVFKSPAKAIPPFWPTSAVAVTNAPKPNNQLSVQTIASELLGLEKKDPETRPLPTLEDLIEQENEIKKAARTRLALDVNVSSHPRRDLTYLSRLLFPNFRGFRCPAELAVQGRLRSQWLGNSLRVYAPEVGLGGLRLSPGVDTDASAGVGFSSGIYQRTFLPFPGTGKAQLSRIPKSLLTGLQIQRRYEEGQRLLRSMYHSTSYFSLRVQRNAPDIHGQPFFLSVGITRDVHTGYWKTEVFAGKYVTEADPDIGRPRTQVAVTFFSELPEDLLSKLWMVVERSATFFPR